MPLHDHHRQRGPHGGQHHPGPARARQRDGDRRQRGDARVPRDGAQYDGVHPWQKVKQGNYPTKAQIYRGLSKMGIGSPKEWQEDFKDSVGTVKQGVQKAEKVVVKEHKQ